MNYFKLVKSNFHMIIQLGLNNFNNRFANTSLGAIWGFIQPFIYMFTYVIVFQYILKVGSANEHPYAVWFLPGMTMWMFVNDSILSGSGSIRNFSYLVKKVVFPVDIIPNIAFISSAIIGIFLLLIAVFVCCIFGYFPNILKFIYIIVAATAFISAITRLTSAICTLVPDFEQLIGVVMQLFFWFTPIVWGVDRLGANMQWIEKIINCLPFTYLVSGFRNVFVPNGVFTAHGGLYTIVFWIITIIIFFWGNKVFNKGKKDFADVL